MNADGTGLRQLTSGVGANSMAAFSPDGRAIAFISTRDGNADLFEMGREGDAPRPLTRTPEPESLPAYFPNGDIAVVVNRAGRATTSSASRPATDSGSCCSRWPGA